MFKFTKKSIQDDKKLSLSPFLCNQIKLLGDCKGQCSERHTLCKILDKECLNIPRECFISIQLTRVLSASHFYGRILKYSTVKDPTEVKNWLVVDDSFEKIKEELILSQNTKMIHTNPTIGEMVMVETEPEQFFRAVIINILTGWFSVSIKVKLIDLGHIKEISPNKVFVLPSHLKEFRPVAVEIILSSVEPNEKIDNNITDWPIETTQLVRGLLEPFILIDLEFICKVELTLGITVWVNWLLAKKCLKCSHFVCKLYENPFMLPKVLIERNLARQNYQRIDNLINLIKDANLWKDPPSSDDSSKNKSLAITKQNTSLFSCEEPSVEIDNEIVVQWAHLSENTVYDVFVNYVENPKCILVHNMQFLDRLVALQKDIDEAINNKTVTQLSIATVETICLAIAPEENKYNRVLIKNIEDQTAIVFYVDYGQYHSVKIETLLTIPSNLITKLPFQIIECNLSGFENILQPDTLNQFNDRLLQLTNTKVYLKVISSSIDAKLTGGSSYEVVLFNNDVNFNYIMSNEFNMYVDGAKIQNILSSNYKPLSYEIEDDYDLYEDLESQFDLLNSLINNSSKEDEKKNELNISHDRTVDNYIKTDEKQIELISKNQVNHLVEDNSINMVDEKIESNSENINQELISNSNKKIKQKSDVKIVNKYCLDCNVTPVVPQCYWHQDKSWIYLKLNIISVKNYECSVTNDTIKINVETESLSYFFKSILFAFIIEESFKCHVSFDGIYIKVQKLVQVKYKWNRLLKCPKKHKYIIYDTEHLSKCINNKKVWIKILNTFKIKAHCQNLKYISDYDSQSDCSDDSDSNENSIYED